MCQCSFIFSFLRCISFRMGLNVNDSLSKEKLILFLSYPLVSDHHIKIYIFFFIFFRCFLKCLHLNEDYFLARLFKVLGPLDHFYFAFLFLSIIIIFQYVVYFSYILHLLLLVHLPLENISILTLLWTVIFFFNISILELVWVVKAKVNK